MQVCAGHGGTHQPNKEALFHMSLCIYAFTCSQKGHGHTNRGHEIEIRHTAFLLYNTDPSENSTH